MRSTTDLTTLETEVGEKNSKPEETEDKNSSKKPPFPVACFLIMLLFLVTGAISGYFRSVFLILTSRKLSMGQLSNLTYSTYPTMFRAPFGAMIDMLHIKCIGRSKTYLIPTGLAMGLLFYFLSPRMADWVEEGDIQSLTLAFLAMNVAGAVFEVAASTWIVTLFAPNDQILASFIKALASDLGEFLTYNLFVPLSNPEWVNSHLYTIEKGGSAPYHHVHVCWGIATVVVAAIVFAAFLVPEQQSISPRDASTREFCSAVSRTFCQKTMMLLIVYFVLILSFQYANFELLDYGMVQNGVTKESLVMCDTLQLPLKFITYIVVANYLSTGSIAFVGHLMAFWGLVVSAGKFFFILMLANNHLSQNSIFIWTFVIKLGWVFVLSSSCYSALFFQIVNNEQAGTELSILTSIERATHIVPRTVAYALADKAGFKSFSIFSLIGQFAILCIFLPVSITLDGRSKLLSEKEQQRRAEIEHAYLLEAENPKLISIRKKSSFNAVFAVY